MGKGTPCLRGPCAACGTPSGLCCRHGFAVVRAIVAPTKAALRQGPLRQGVPLPTKFSSSILGKLDFFRDRLGINRGSNCASWDHSRFVLFFDYSFPQDHLGGTIFFTQWSAGGVAALFRRHRSRPLPAHGCANPRSGRQRARMACRRSVEPK